MRAIRYIVLHCTATAPSAKVASIERYWREQLGWKNPGYHIIITPDGVAHRLATDDTICNGVAGHNGAALHVSYVGGIDATGQPQDNRTSAQIATQKRVIREWLTKYPSAEVLGHRDFPRVAKACPSFDARAWWRSVGALLLLLIFTWGTAGCQRRLVAPATVQTLDSTTTTEHIRFVEVAVPGDTVRQFIQLECDPVTGKVKPFVAQADGQNGRANQTLAVDANGQLQATATCDAWRDSVAVRDRLITRLRSETRTLYVNVPRPLAWYDKASRWLAGLAVVAVAAGLYRRFNS